MLQIIRDKLTGWVAGFIFFVIALAFTFWGIDPLSIGATWAARVNGIEIPANDVRRAAQDRVSQFESLYKNDISPAMLEQIRSSVMEMFINNALVRDRVNSGGYRVSDEMLSKYIRNLPYFQVGGEFSLDGYLAALRSQGLSKISFERDQRNKLEVLQLQQGLVGSSFVTPGEMRRFLELQGEEREVTRVTLTAGAFADAVKPTDDEISEYYNLNIKGFMSEESADVEYLEVGIDDFKDQVEVSDQGLRDYYETIADKYQNEEQRKARHILIATSDTRDDTAAQARADEVLKRIDAGEDFAALAAEYSDDGGTSAAGGELGWSAAEDFVGPFADTLFAMQPGETAGPVKTRFGYHIIRLDEIKGSNVKPFDEVRAEIEDDYRSKLSEDSYYEAAQNLGDQSFEAYDQLESVAEALGLELRHAKGFTRAGGGELGSDERLIGAVFSPEVLHDGRNSDLLEIDDGRALVLRVAAYQPSQTRSLDEVRDEIVRALVRTQTRVLARSAGTGVKTALASGANPQKLAEDNKAVYTGPMKVNRGTPNVPPVLLEAIFSAPKPTADHPSVGGVSLATGDYAIFEVTSVTPGHPASLTTDDWNKAEQAMADQFGNGELAAYVAQLRDSGDVDINPRTFETVLNPPVMP